MQVGKNYQISTKGSNGRKRKFETVEIVAEYDKFYLAKTENYKITIMKSSIKSGECKFKEIKQAAS